MAKGVLVDLTKCYGCGSCTVACKLWNKVEFDEENDPTVGENVALSGKNWTVVQLNEVKKDNTPVWRFTKHQCFHCKEPACASACLAKAMQKTPEGPVVYYPSLCVGCRYCILACPFDIPKYTWEKSIPVVAKCQMCSTKIAQGEMPACVSVCPNGVFKFGERDDLLNEAKSIIANNDRYINRVYGENEVGGTSWLYISDVPFEELGFDTNITTKPLPDYTWKILNKIPGTLIGWSAILCGIYFFTNRCKEVAETNKKK